MTPLTELKEKIPTLAYGKNYEFATLSDVAFRDMLDKDRASTVQPSGITVKTNDMNFIIKNGVILRKKYGNNFKFFFQRSKINV